MNVYSDERPDVYSVSGHELRIHWDIQEITLLDMDGSERVQWEYKEALCHTYDKRDTLIEKIIGSVHTAGAEIALINNKEVDPEAYAEYQTFRAEAKSLADGWVGRLLTS